MVNMGGMSMPMKLDAKDIHSIMFRSCKIKKLFKEIESEKLVLFMDKMPKLTPPPGMPVALDGEGGRTPQPPADKKPKLVSPKTACGKEFDAYKSIPERFANTNGISFTM